MAADEGHGPHPRAQDPPVPCGSSVPGFVPPLNKHLPTPAAGSGGRQVVDRPSSYEIVGKVLLAASGAFAGIFLALIVLHMCNGGRRRGSRDRRRRRLLRSLAIAGADGDEVRDGGAAPSPRGLDPAVLRALPVVVASAGAEAGDCAVCLAEFEAGEKARALPRCGHRFHVECIDAWFRENSTCPLCRADVEAPDSAAADGQPEVRIDIAGDTVAAAAAAKSSAPAMGRLPSGTDLEKTRRVFTSTRSASF
ncbi:RING-H2 finger protein ATL64-like [Oryza brachyantha]|uniref:RING-H2 finger protein ATL64-like n=1 Tax=Oryza brachyantha TaxID=4533 RepID=UPI001ADC4F0D|nr:RING-H2 finger protein ATL64-like [Oryza brachyantha]